MKAAVLYATGEDLVIEDVGLAEPREQEVCVDIGAVGVCRSDLGAARGHGGTRLPMILGHEAAGLVSAVGPGVSHLSPGDRVTLSWAPSCGRCFYCHRGQPAQCELYARAAGAGTLFDGSSRLRNGRGETVHHFACQSSFAEQAVVPASACSPLPDGVPMAVAALVGCAVTTGFGAVLNDAGIGAGDNLAIFGLGGVGLSALMASQLLAPSLVACVDPNPRKREVALSFGASHFIDPASEDAPATLHDHTAGRGVDAVIECSGRPAAFAAAWASLRPGGTLVVVGQAHRGESYTLAEGRNLPMHQKRIVGSYYGGGVPERDFERVYAAYRAGRLPLDRLVGETVPLEAINDSLHALEAGVDTRTVVVF